MAYGKKPKWPSLQSGQVFSDGSAPNSIDIEAYLGKLKVINHIGYTSCASTFTEGDHSYLVYKYDVFRDARRERNLFAHRTMFVDAETRLPVKFENSGSDGSITAQETRRYDASLKVEAPVSRKLSPR